MLSKTVKNSQRGIVLFLTIIVLVAMSLAAIGLMRGVLASNRVSGNLAFQQSALHAADVGTEVAIAWLEQRSRELTVVPGPPESTRPANVLHKHIDKTNDEPIAYRANRENPDRASKETWEQFWTAQVKSDRVNYLPPDAAGNNVSFMIHRLCAAAGDPLSGAACEAPPQQDTSTATSGKRAGVKLKVPGMTYYRITVRVQGPRNAVSFTQTVVAI